MSKKIKVKFNQKELRNIENSIEPIRINYDKSKTLNQQIEEIANQLVEIGITPDIEGIRAFIQNETE